MIICQVLKPLEVMIDLKLLTTYFASVTTEKISWFKLHKNKIKFKKETVLYPLNVFHCNSNSQGYLGFTKILTTLYFENQQTEYIGESLIFFFFLKRKLFYTPNSFYYTKVYIILILLYRI